MYISTIGSRNHAWPASLPRVHLEPGLISRRALSTLVDFTFCGCYPRCGEIAPETRARSASMNDPIITCPTVRTEINLTSESTAGIYGYFQGIAGKMLLKIAGKDR